MLKWRPLFESRILDRGRNCETNGAVVGLHWDAGSWEAMVVGTQLYRVRVQLSRGQAEKLKCNCPHAGKGLRCKHMAAVFYAFERRANDVLNDDDAALSARADGLSTDEASSCLQLAIDCGSTRCTALMLNRTIADGEERYSIDEFTLDDLPEDASGAGKADRQGDNGPMKLLFPN